MRSGFDEFSFFRHINKPSNELSKQFTPQVYDFEMSFPDGT